MTDAQRLTHYARLMGRLIGCSESLASYVTEYARSCEHSNMPITAAVARGSLERWNAAVKEWETRDEGKEGQDG